MFRLYEFTEEDEFSLDNTEFVGRNFSSPDSPKIPGTDQERPTTQKMDRRQLNLYAVSRAKQMRNVISDKLSPNNHRPIMRSPSN